MIKIYIIADSFKHFETGIKEYEKRLGKSCKLIKLKPVKNGSIKQIIEKETDNIINKLKKEKGYKIVLNPEGKSFSTEKFYTFMESKKQNYSKISFIIGGAYGLSYDKLKNHINFELNLGKLTMPHSLALLVLLEQVYRIGMIKKGTNYHK